MGVRRGSPSWRVCASTTAVVACFIEDCEGATMEAARPGQTSGIPSSSAKQFRDLEVG